MGMFIIDFGRLNNEVGLAIGGKNAAQLKIGDIVAEATKYAFGIAGLILLLYLVWGGFMFMTSHGDQKAVEAARQKITSAIVGFVIIFVAYWLVQLLGMIFDVHQFKFIFP